MRVNIKSQNGISQNGILGCFFCCKYSIYNALKQADGSYGNERNIEYFLKKSGERIKTKYNLTGMNRIDRIIMGKGKMQKVQKLSLTEAQRRKEKLDFHSLRVSVSPCENMFNFEDWGTINMSLCWSCIQNIQYPTRKQREYPTDEGKAEYNLTGIDRMDRIMGKGEYPISVPRWSVNLSVNFCVFCVFCG